MAARVLRKIGGTPSTTIVARVGQNPSPRPNRIEIGSRIPSSAYGGIAAPMPTIARLMEPLRR